MQLWNLHVLFSAQHLSNKNNATDVEKNVLSVQHVLTYLIVCQSTTVF